MARDYHIGFYFCDPDDTFENWEREEVEKYISRCFEDEYFPIRPRHTHAIRSNYYDWDDNVPENNPELPMEVFEERFLE